jgi:hypothetical protein
MDKDATSKRSLLTLPKLHIRRTTHTDVNTKISARSASSLSIELFVKI